MEYFLAAAKLLSFTEAAERLYITQPSLSRQIAAMEQELGIPLFARGRNSLTLTQAGQKFYERMSVLYSSYLETLEEVRDIDSGRVGYLSIGLLEDQILSESISDAIRRLIKHYPKTEVTICRKDSTALFEGLLDGSLDIAQMLIYDEITLEHLSTLPLYTDNVHLAISKKHPVAEFDEVSMDDVFSSLKVMPLVMAALDTFPLPMRKALSNYPPCNIPGTNFPALKLVSTVSSIPLYVTAGLGGTLVNPGNLLSIDPNVKLIPVIDGPTMTSGLVWRTENSNPILGKVVSGF